MLLLRQGSALEDGFCVQLKIENPSSGADFLLNSKLGKVHKGDKSMSEQQFYDALGTPIQIEGEIVAETTAPNGFVRCILKHPTGRLLEAYIKRRQPPEKNKPAPS